MTRTTLDGPTRLAAVLALTVLACTAGAVHAEDKTAKLEAAKPMVKQLLLLMDTDKSGEVSKAEFMHFMEAEFDRLDTNHSGELDINELKSLQFHGRHTGGSGSK